MKKVSKFLIVLFIFLLQLSCKTEQIIIEKPTPVETPQLKATALEVESAFLLADSKKLEALILPAYLAQYKSAIQGNDSKLAEYGKIFKTREIIAGDSVFAVYKIEYKGSNYQITMGTDGTGKWKLINF